MNRLIIFSIISIIGIFNSYCEEFEIAYNQDSDQPYWLIYRTLDDAPGTVDLINTRLEIDKAVAEELDDYRIYVVDLLDITATVVKDGYEYTVTKLSAGNFGGGRFRKIIIPSTVRWINGGFGPWTISVDIYDVLEELVIDNAPIEEISNTFQFCRHLKSINFGNACTLTELPLYCFYDCTSLSEVQLPESLTNIDFWTFKGCTSLKSITLPPNISSLYEVFPDCISLEEVKYDGNSLLWIGGGTFKNCESLKSIYFPSVIDVAEEAFQNCSSLATVTTSADQIGAHAFENCVNLMDLQYDMNNLSIGEAAFKNCISLQSISLPSNLSIGAQAFAGCTSLEKFDVQSSEYDYYSTIDGVLIACGNQLVAYPAGKRDTDYTVPESITSIGNGAFEGSQYLTGITLHGNITDLGVMALRDCKALRQVNMPASLDHVPFGTFSGCTSLENVNMPDSYVYIGPSSFEECSSLSAVKLPSELKVLGESAFADCYKIESIELPAQVKEIRSNTFKNCESLQTLTLSANIDTIHSGAIQGCRELRQIDLPVTLKSLEDRAFKGCKSLEKIIIPDGVTAVGINAFEECSSLKEVTVGNGVKEIGQWAFYDCTAMESLMLGSSLESIGAEAFDGDVNIRDITCLAITPPSFPGGFPPEVIANATVTVPEGSENAYNTDPCWDPLVEGEVHRAESISLNITEIELKRGESVTLVATVLPEDAIDKSVTWSTGSVLIATVNDLGVVTGEIYASPLGSTTTITATTSNGLTATCMVTVSENGNSSVDILSDENGCFDIYSLSGTLVKKNADADYIRNLPKGIYIIHTADKAVRIVI